MKFINLIGLLVIVAACGLKQKPNEELHQKPNIIIIYTDDVGFGDIGANSAIGVKTPNIDRLAENGLNFTDAHCSSATCTPSRFSLLTGSYAFRKNASILPGDAPLLIDTNKGTLPKMLQKAGYKTAVIGKWHLGLGNGNINWNKEISPGAKEVGFDYSFIIPATPDRVPCVFVENGMIANLDPNDPVSVSYKQDLGGYPTGTDRPDLLKVAADKQHSGSIINGMSRIGFMKGGKNALWIDEDFPSVLTNKAQNFITENKKHPFFLYFALPDIHVPRMPNAEFIGKSKMGPRGDAIAETDWYVGKIINLLENMGLSKNTLVIFSSDNGPILNDGYEDQAIELLGDHKPAGPYSGAKYSILEAGTRVPNIVYWPEVVKPGVSAALLSHIDLYASLAKLVGGEIKEDDAPDSEELLDAWLGKTEHGRQFMLEEAFTFGLRMDNWKYIKPNKGGTPDWMKNKKVDGGMSEEIQLYNLDTDIGETINVASEHPELVKKMEEKLQKILLNVD